MPPGQEGKITLSVKTDRYHGAITKTARVYSNDPSNKVVLLTIKANIKHLVDFTPSHLSIRTTRGKAAEGRVTLVNNDTSPLEILGVESNSEDFTPTLRTLEKGKRYEILVRLKPQPMGGQLATMITVRTNNEKSPQLMIPVNAVVAARVEAFPRRLIFRQFKLEALKKNPRLQFQLTRWFTVRGQQQGFKVNKVEASLPFVHTEVLAPKREGQSYRIKVTLVEDKLKPGPFKGTIRVRTNDKEFAELKIPISGKVL